MRILRWSLLLFICPQVFSQIPSPDPDYRKIFGNDYNYAIKTIEKHSIWSDTLSEDGLDPDFAISIIFPELIRYSSIIDYIEVKGLEVLYVQYGMDYADFSIGLFQMKPSFAEHIESDILKYNLTGKFPSLSALCHDLSETSNARMERIIRLKDENYQLLYLEAFIRIMDAIYPDLLVNSTQDRLILDSLQYRLLQG
jgi:hypothetical protein